MLQVEANTHAPEASALPSTSRHLSGEYWKFFSAAFFFDAGFAIYFFLFNLFLLELHADERTIGLINAAFTLGSTLATLPAGALVQQRGARHVLGLCFVAAPLFGIARLYAPSTTMQVALAFVAGAAMCLWGVGYLPAVAALTNSVTRAKGYSFIFSASIITSALGAFVSSRVPQLLVAHGYKLSALAIKQRTLVAACLLSAIGIIPVLRLRELKAEVQAGGWRAGLLQFRPGPFLLTFLLCMSLWTAVVGAFATFGNVYLLKSRGLSLEAVGTLFATTQVLQLLLGMCTPAVLSFFGAKRGVLLIQCSAMLCLSVLPTVSQTPAAMGTYALLSALVWMGSPALYSLLMNGVSEQQRSAAASMTLFCGSVAASVATSVAGVSIRAFGYDKTFVSLAVLGGCSAAAMYLLMRRQTSENV